MPRPRAGASPPQNPRRHRHHIQRSRGKPGTCAPPHPSNFFRTCRASDTRQQFPRSSRRSTPQKTPAALTTPPCPGLAPGASRPQNPRRDIPRIQRSRDRPGTCRRLTLRTSAPVAPVPPVNSSPGQSGDRRSKRRSPPSQHHHAPALAPGPRPDNTPGATGTISRGPGAGPGHAATSPFKLPHLSRQRHPPTVPPVKPKTDAPKTLAALTTPPCPGPRAGASPRQYPRRDRHHIQRSRGKPGTWPPPHPSNFFRICRARAARTEARVNRAIAASRSPSGAAS